MTVTELPGPALRIGLVDFNDPTLLLLGDPHSFTWLAGELEARRPVVLASPPGEEVVELRLLPSRSPVIGTTELTAPSSPPKTRKARRISRF